jgi:hypothetical protein
MDRTPLAKREFLGQMVDLIDLMLSCNRVWSLHCSELKRSTDAQPRFPAPHSASQTPKLVLDPKLCLAKEFCPTHSKRLIDQLISSRVCFAWRQPPSRFPRVVSRNQPTKMQISVHGSLQVIWMACGCSCHWRRTRHNRLLCARGDWGTWDRKQFK